MSAAHIPRRGGTDEPVPGAEPGTLSMSNAIPERALRATEQS